MVAHQYYFSPSSWAWSWQWQWLAVIMISIFLVSSPSLASSVNQTVYNIAVLVPLNVTAPGFPGINGIRYYAQAYQAWRDLQSGNITLNPPLPANVSVQILQVNTAALARIGIKAAVDTITYDNSLALIGPAYSDVALPIASVGSAMQRPVFSPTSQSFLLSDRISMPYFMRGRAPDTAVAYVFNALFQRHGWNRICLLGTLDVFGRGIVSKLREIAPELELHDEYFSVDTNQIPDCLAALIRHLDAGCRIFVFNALITGAQYIMAAANQLSLLNNPTYQILGNSDWAETYQLTYPSGPSAYGVISATFAKMTDGRFQRHASRFPSLFGPMSVYKWDQYPLLPQEPVWYDCFLYTVQAMSNILYRNESLDGASLLAEMHNMTYEGISGPFIFDNETYDRIQDYNVFQVDVGGRVRVVEQYSLANHVLMDNDVANEAYIWPGGGTQPARDGTSIILGDVIKPQVDGSLVVLSFFMGSVGSWVAMIMTEQLIYNATKRIDWIHWAVACAIAYGGGTWTMHLIALGSLDWPVPVTIVYRESYALIALVVSFACAALGFIIALIGWRVHRSNNDDSHTSNSPQRPVLPPSNDLSERDHHYLHGGSDASRGSGGGGAMSSPPSPIPVAGSSHGHSHGYGHHSHYHQHHSHGHGAGVTRATHATAASSAGAVISIEPGSPRSDLMNDERAAANFIQQQQQQISCCDNTGRDERAAKYKYDTSVKAQLLLSLHRINIYFAIAGLILSIGSQVSHALLRQSLPPSVSPDVNVAQDILISILTSIVFIPALLVIFFFFPASPVRPFGALILHVSSFSVHHIQLRLETIIYRPSSIIAADIAVWSPLRTVLSIVTAAFACACATMVMINYSRMSVSRQSLNELRRKFRDDLDHTTDRLNQQMIKEQWLLYQIQSLWKTLDTINLSRPLPRDYTLLLTMADRQANELVRVRKRDQKDKDKDNHDGGDRDKEGSRNHTNTGTGGNGSRGTGHPVVAPATSSKASAYRTLMGMARRGSQSRSRSRSQQSQMSVTQTGRSLEQLLEEAYRSPSVKVSSSMALYNQLSRLHANHASHERASREVKLDHIITHPIAMEIFKDFLMAPTYKIPPEVGLDSFTAMMDCKRYRECRQGSLRAVLGRELFDLFVAPGARLRLRLPDLIRRPLYGMFGRATELSPAAVSSPPVELYQPMEDHLRALIQTSFMTRFIASDTFPFVAALIRPSPFRINAHLTPMSTRSLLQCYHQLSDVSSKDTNNPNGSGNGACHNGSSTGSGSTPNNAAPSKHSSSSSGTPITPGAMAGQSNSRGSGGAANGSMARGTPAVLDHGHTYVPTGGAPFTGGTDIGSAIANGTRNNSSGDISIGMTPLHYVQQQQSQPHQRTPTLAPIDATPATVAALVAAAADPLSSAQSHPFLVPTVDNNDEHHTSTNTNTNVPVTRVVIHPSPVPPAHGIPLVDNTNVSSPVAADGFTRQRPAIIFGTSPSVLPRLLGPSSSSQVATGSSSGDDTSPANLTHFYGHRPPLTGTNAGNGAHGESQWLLRPPTHNTTQSPSGILSVTAESTSAHGSPNHGGTGTGTRHIGSHGIDYNQLPLALTRAMSQ